MITSSLSHTDYTRLMQTLNRAIIASDYLSTITKDTEPSIEDMDGNVGIADISEIISEEIKAARILVSGMRQDEKEASK